MSSNKKAKMDNDAFAKVKDYLLACPDVPKDHPAIQAALRGIAQEEQLLARDTKLQQKFSKKAAATSSSPPAIAIAESNETDLEVIQHEKEPRRSSPNPSSEGEEEWQEVPVRDSTTDDGAASLGEALAQVSVQSLAHHKIQVRQPWQALAVALHGALRSHLLDFRCTGKEDPTPTAGGFAAPIRELPATQFLPGNLWNNPNVTEVALRYRKAGTGSVVLSVTLIKGGNNDELVLVTFGPSKSQEGTAEPLRVKIADHVNMDSWTKASSRGKPVAPSLHYINLSAFLTCFCQRFDVGSIHDSTEAKATNPAAELPYVDRSIQTLAARPDPANALRTTVGAPSNRPVEPWMREQHQPPTIDSAFGLRIPGRGDFAGDLVPGGLNVDPLGGGNQMGPNHPMFSGGPHGMVPRFDPFGPPQPDMGGNRRSQGRPNHDHMRPPSNLNNNMFM